MKKNSKTDQTIVGHLTEVRKRLIISILAFVITVIIVFQFTEPIVQDMISKSNGMNFVYIEPTELFITFIEISLISGLIVILPFLLFQLWLFIKPGLKKNEKTGLAIALTAGLFLFALGSLFAYFIVVPMTTMFFMGFRFSNIPPMISFRSYFTYILSIVISFGIAFEFPILIIILTSIGIMKSSFLARQRKYILLIVLVIAAIITPPDVVSQVLITIPLMILFEIGIFVGSRVEKRRNKKKNADASFNPGNYTNDSVLKMHDGTDITDKTGIQDKIQKTDDGMEKVTEEVINNEENPESHNGSTDSNNPQGKNSKTEGKTYKSVREQIREFVENGEMMDSEDEKF